MRKAITLLPIILAGCGQYQQRMQEQARFNAERDEIRKQEYCEQIGAPKGSDKYFECRKWMVQMEMQQGMYQASQSAYDPGTAALQQIAVQPTGLETNRLQAQCVTRPIPYSNQVETICQ